MNRLPNRIYCSACNAKFSPIYQDAAGRCLDCQRAARGLAPIAIPVAVVVTSTQTRRSDAHTCARCGAYADMWSSFGPACPRHYDEMAG